MWALLERTGNALRCSQGVRCTYGRYKESFGASGHAVIQVDQNGQEQYYHLRRSQRFRIERNDRRGGKEVEEGDIVLLQNEISNVGYAAETAKEGRSEGRAESVPDQRESEDDPDESGGLFYS